MLPPDNSEPDLRQLMARLNANDAVLSILVQLQQRKSEGANQRPAQMTAPAENE